MALRSVAQVIRGLSYSSNELNHIGFRAFSAAPTVFDKMVQFFLIDKAGVRHTVNGLSGQTLADALSEFEELEVDSLMPHVYEPARNDAHVYVAYDYLSKLPKLSEEQEEQQARLLEDFARQKARANSRMAYFITLSPELNGLTVALGDMEPWYCE